MKKEIKEHVHKMKKTGMTMYCKCGFYFNIQCGHKWVFERDVPIEIEKMGGNVSQSRKQFHCSECGALRDTNTTTGVTRITV